MSEQALSVSSSFASYYGNVFCDSQYLSNYLSVTKPKLKLDSIDTYNYHKN